MESVDMVESLVPTTPEDYVKLTTKLVRTRTGAVFLIRAMGANPMVHLLRVIPEGGLVDDETMMFLKDHFAILSEKVIVPCIIEPKIPSDELAFIDSLDIFTDLMALSGLSSEGVAEREGFREEPDRSDT